MKRFQGRDRWVNPYEPRGTANEPAHLLLFYLPIATGASLPLQSLDPPLERVTKRARIRDEVFQFCRDSLGSGLIGDINGPRVKFGNARDIVVKLLQAALDGGDLKRGERQGISLGRLRDDGNG